MHRASGVNDTGCTGACGVINGNKLNGSIAFFFYLGTIKVVCGVYFIAEIKWCDVYNFVSSENN
jgi:hypothetical protein